MSAKIKIVSSFLTLFISLTVGGTVPDPARIQYLENKKAKNLKYLRF